VTESRKLAAILVADVVGFSRLAGADEERLLARLRALRSDLIDPTIAVHKGRVVKRTGDGAIVEFRSAVDAVRCAIEVQDAMVERNAGVPEDRRIVFRMGIHVGDVVEESDGDLMGDGVNIAARLEGVATPGAICLSEDAYRQVKARLDLAVTDMGETRLKNIAEPIRTFSLQVGSRQAAKPAPASSPASPKPAAHEKPSIAALPFQNMSGDPEQEYFVDGLVEDILTGLARVKSMTVIARNSSFTYKGKAVDVRQVGQELGARYVLEGSVRKGGNKLRITAQLIEAETGAHLWADRFEGGLDDVFDLQDRITERIVGVIEPNVLKSEIERSRRKHPDNLAAYDLCLRAMPHLYLPIPDGAKAAAPLLEQALRIDPNFPAAHAWLSRCHEILFLNGGFHPADRDAGIAHAEAVIASNTDDATALSVAGFNLWQLGQNYDRAVATIERALSHNPCCIWALTSGALVYALGGEAAKARTFADRSLRLSPFDPAAWGVHFVRTFAALIEGRPDEAVSHAVAAVHLHPHFGGLHAVHASALVLAGRSEEGRAVARRAVELFPSYNQGWIGQMVRDPVLRETLQRGGKLAGLPD
jgi:TolB-like protein/class 3 adenylate cyclase